MKSTDSPKTQAALLEAMAEKRVSAGTEDFRAAFFRASNTESRRARRNLPAARGATGPLSTGRLPRSGGRDPDRETNQFRYLGKSLNQ